MNKITYTAYLPIVVSRDSRKRSQSSSIASGQLRDYTNRLDRYDRKLNDLDDTCLTNLDKCKIYYNSSQNRESRLKNTLRETRNLIKKSSPALSTFSSPRTASIRYSSKLNYRHSLNPELRNSNYNSDISSGSSQNIKSYIKGVESFISKY